MKIKIENASKIYGKSNALEEVNLEVAPKEIVGIIGPNGSGKTTLLNLIMGLIKPTSGSVIVDRAGGLGMSVSRQGFFDDMTVLRNLLMYSSLVGTSRDNLSRLMHTFQIDFGSKRFGELSAGMKQRVALLTGFLKEYQLILLDEPTNHLDIDSILILRGQILSRNESGCSFLITSHILSDLEKVCQRVLFLSKGKVISAGNTIDLISQYGSLEEAYLNLVSKE